MAIMYLALNRVKESHKTFLHAFSLDPSNTVVKNNLGQLVGYLSLVP